MAAVFPILNNLKYKDLVADTSNLQNAINWAENQDLLPQQNICPICQRFMVETAGNAQWRCPRPCRKRIGYRVDTFFEHSHLSISEVIDLVYHVVLWRTFGEESQTRVWDWKRPHHSGLAKFYASHLRRAFNNQSNGSRRTGSDGPNRRKCLFEVQK